LEHKVIAVHSIFCAFDFIRNSPTKRPSDSAVLRKIIEPGKKLLNICGLLLHFNHQNY